MLSLLDRLEPRRLVVGLSLEKDDLALSSEKEQPFEQWLIVALG